MVNFYVVIFILDFYFFRLFTQLETKTINSNKAIKTVNIKCHLFSTYANVLTDGVFCFHDGNISQPQHSP